MNDREKAAADRFCCTVKERAIFESGIKLATIYHQFVGTPFDLSTVDDLERTIERTISLQPYVSSVRVSIDRSDLTDDHDIYGYISLTGDMIYASVTVDIDGATVTSEMRYDKDLGYPLMYVSRTD